ncbi:cell envelope integrity protein CreD [Pseudoduganella ginsengisoli]|uniref:Cell envelope integrity protein CreD n=1 Tax=Pseudoduganella ginsengisoli TaxID=1462440 RepID=A0A6L6Q3L6_9BURK|nr:cell envelope integrity protein CreD [Pseudoduganella ginsengisoli]MTW03652.1 cell envelope integrity protein CreD [Pseudoduganella ginsengisoli]
MQLFKKIGMIIVLMLLLGVPLMMIENTVASRMSYRQEAVASIASDSVGEQTVTGPVLVVPYTEEVDVRETTAEGKVKITTNTVQRHHLVFPDDLLVTGSIGTERRHRGIHEVLVYNGQHQFSGSFALPVEADLPRAKDARVAAGQPYLALPIEDVRGLRDIPQLQWAGATVEFAQDARLGAYKRGLHAKLGPAVLEGGTASFAFALNLAGMERLSFIPVGKNNVVTLKSDWPHPQFNGRFLPEKREISDAGFAATWRVPSLAANVRQELLNMAANNWEGRAETAAATAQANGAPAASAPDRFSVALAEPVNTYSLAGRATKYGLLFVALTFAAFFVFEILKSLPIHPVQYALVGLSLALFFLLLLALSEHFPFVLAYCAASIGCIGLIGYYLAHVLYNRRRGFAFGGALTLLYGALYGLLCSEDNALVMGAILLFAVLAAIMVATRKVDWYQLGSGTQDVQPEARQP